MNRDEKTALVSELKDKAVNSDCVILVHYRGLTDKQLYDMRVALKSKDCGMKIAKNTLIRIAIKDTELEGLSEYLKGPTALLYSKDPVALSKIVSDTAKANEALKFQAGFLDKALVPESTIKSLASLGSLDDVRASFIGVLNAAQSNFVRILNAPSEGLASSFAKEEVAQS